MKASVASRNALRTSIILLVFAFVGTAILAFTHQSTEPTIARGQQAAKLALLSQVLPAALYDNDLLSSSKTVPPNDLLGTRLASSLWLARHNGHFSGVVLEAIAPDGYSGEIALLIGVDAHGSVTGVRVTAHRETPGLGDYIERTKSAWIDQFSGKSLNNPPAKHWKVVKDGGAFDARAGATITPRAVVRAVKGALEYFAKHRAEFNAPPAKEPQA
ncbi:MAG: electron transport complex subunit RsxG [Thiobacillus sp.]|nr:electron transport complex subunit RsxG [Thiobacillus sp.]